MKFQLIFINYTLSNSGIANLGMQNHSSNKPYHSSVGVLLCLECVFENVLSRTKCRKVSFNFSLKTTTIEDCTKDGGEEFFTEMQCARITNL